MRDRPKAAFYQGGISLLRVGRRKAKAPEGYRWDHGWRSGKIRFDFYVRVTP